MFNRFQNMFMPMYPMMNPMMPTMTMPRCKQPELAQAYIPYQQFVKSFSPEEALEQGTMFPELVRPYRKCEKGC